MAMPQARYGREPTQRSAQAARLTQAAERREGDCSVPALTGKLLCSAPSDEPMTEGTFWEGARPRCACSAPAAAPRQEQSIARGG